MEVEPQSAPQGFSLRLFLNIGIYILTLGTGLHTASAHAESPPAVTPKPYLLGVFPHLGANQIEKSFAPIAADLARVLGRPVELRTRPTFETFAEELARETFDIAFVQPFDYPAAHDAHGYLPLARRDEPLVARLVVREDSAVATLKDLKDMNIGLPPENAAVSHLILMMAAAQKFSLNSARVTYYKAHDSCLNALLVGTVAACGTAPYPQRFFESKWKIKFRVVAESASIPHALFVAHRRMSEKDREAVREAVLSWGNTDVGRRLLAENALTPFVPATDAEYEPVRAYIRRHR